MYILNLPNIKSTSWKDEFFPFFIHNAIKYLKPDLCVELGTYAGYSAYCIGTALVENMKGHLECYDLWEKYPFNHTTKEEATFNLLGLPIELRLQDATLAYENYDKNTVDFLMVDISNDGKVYKDTLMNWYDKLTSKASVFLEGGSEERDEVEWMKKYNKIPIRKTVKNKDLMDSYTFVNVGGFPSLTIAQKKI